MAVFMLAQFDIRIPETEAVPNIAPKIWYEGVGLIANGTAPTPPYNALAGGLGVLSLDGVFRDRVAGNTLGGGSYQGASWWPAKKRMVEVWSVAVDDNSNEGPNTTHAEAREMVFDPYVFARQATSPAGVTHEALASKRYVKLPDRSVYYVGGFPPSGFVYGVVDNVATQEGPTGGVGFYNGSVMPGRSDTEVFISGQRFVSGFLPPEGVFYDTVTRELCSPYYRIGVPAKGLFYAREWGVMVSVHDPEAGGSIYPQIRIWALEVRPTIVTTPEVVEGEVKSGQIVTFRVRVTGAQNDPAEGELVNWELPVGSAGALHALQSKTDKDGYATVKVQYDVGEVGTCELEATVEA